MRVAVLSGKGGTGKTFVSVNLAAAAKRSTYFDCDVEEPDGHLFFKPENTKTKAVNICIPVWVQSRCNACRQCVEFCRFNALAYINGRLIVFEDVCHACGGCLLLCPTKALTEKQRPIGQIIYGTSDSVTVISGILNVGEVSGVPIVKALVKNDGLKTDDIEILDCPSGSARIVMESIKTSDFCLLVAEPTLFGAHDLEMVHALVKLFKKPYAAVLNKCMDGDDPAERYCQKAGINVLARIPFDRSLGALNTQGRIAVKENDNYLKVFESLLQIITGEDSHEATADIER